MKRLGNQAALTLAVLAGAASVSPAADRFWVGGSNYWDYAANWSTTDHGTGNASVPVNGDNVYIDPVGTTIVVSRDNVTPSYAAPGLNTLTINATSGGSAAVYQYSGNAMYAGTMTLGSTGTGSYVQNGGTASFTNLVLGAQAGSTGTYTLNNATASLVVGTAYIGAFPGSGAAINVGYTQNAGAATFNTFSAAASVNAKANVSLAGGSLQAANFYVGSDGGYGTFTQSGGSINVTTNGYIGHGDGSAVYNLTGGSANYKRLDLADFTGDGTINISGGTLTTGGLDMGLYGSGKVNLTNGALNVGTLAMRGYNNGRPTSINASAGTFTLGNYGTASTSVIYNTDTVNITGSNQFNLNNANLVVDGGVFNLNSSAAAQFYSGSSLTVQNGGVFNALSQDINVPTTLSSGGVLNLSKDHPLYSTLVLNGGQINTPTLYAAYNVDYVTFNSGTINITSTNQLYVAPNRAGGSVLGEINLDASKALIAAGSIRVVGTSTTLNGGTLSGGDFSFEGPFTFNSGTLRLTAANLYLGANGLFGPQVVINGAQRFETTGTNQIIFNPYSLILQNGGTLTAAGGYVNNGELLLASPLGSINGGTLTNNNLISGTGRINSTLANGASGNVRVATDDRITFNGGGNSNAGTIQLLGGIIEFNGGLINNKTIAGRGSLYANGGLTNNGTLLFASGPADVFGNVANGATGKVLVTGGADATIYNNLTSAAGASIKVDSGSVLSILGTVNGGSFGGAGTIVFQSISTPSYISGSGAAIVDVGGSVKTATLTENSLTLHGPLTLSGGGSSVSKVQNLSIDSGQTLDLTNNRLVIDYSDASPLATIRGELLGGQIVSTSASKNQRIGYAEASEVHASTFGGTSVDSTSLLLMSTLAGDCNLDGKVDIVDLGLLAGSWQKTNGDWFNGDYNYDGKVNIVDLGLLAGNWQSKVPLATAMAELNFNVTPTPEPGMISLVAVGGLTLRRRRA